MYVDLMEYDSYIFLSYIIFVKRITVFQILR